MWIAKRSYVTISGNSSRADVQPLPVILVWGITAMLYVGIAFNILLSGSIFYGSFTIHWCADDTLPLNNFTQLLGRGFSDEQTFIDGEDVTDRSIQQRDIGVVFQSYALFPHMSLGENIGYGLKMLGRPKAEIKDRGKEALAGVGGFADRYVVQISGSQQQRVTLARALLLKPKVLLFNEPLVIWVPTCASACAIKFVNCSSSLISLHCMLLTFKANPLPFQTPYW